MHVNEAREHTVVIIGASHAGVNAAFSLRKEAYTGNIIILDADNDLPYHKPPLSKKALLDTSLLTDGLQEKTSQHAYLLKAEAAYQQQNITLRLAERAVLIDRNTKTIVTQNTDKIKQQENTIKYDDLILATGSRAFIPPITGIKNNPSVFTLRTLHDTRAIQRYISNNKVDKAAVIGGGYIGLETAASLRKLNIEVTVIEREPRVLARVTSPEMSAYFTQLHKTESVNIYTNKTVQAIEPCANNQQKIICADGSVYQADIVIIGVGIRVNTELAEAADLACENGIKVNANTQTYDKHIYAIGDCAVFFHPRYQRQIRLESVQNALDQAKVVAKNIMGKAEQYNELPWFWSDQYSTKLQIVGLLDGYTQLVKREEPGSPASLSFWYFNGQELLAVDAINNAKAYVLATKALKNNLVINKQRLTDESQALSVNIFD